MSEAVAGKIVDIDDTGLTVHVPYADWGRYCLRKYEDVQVLLTDGRQISVKQSNAIHAMIHDIAAFDRGYAWKPDVHSKTLAEMELLWLCDLTEDEEFRYALKMRWCELTERPFFSLSTREPNCIDCTGARDFLGWLIDLCVKHAIPCSGGLIDRAEDISRYLYQCIAHKRCAICGKPADLHHVDHVGMGSNRDEICHLGLRAESLCRTHHDEAHSLGQLTFDVRYHLFGITLDETLCLIHNLQH